MNNNRNIKKNILFCMNWLGGGGAERVLVDIINNLDKEKYDITLFLVSKTGVNLKKLNKNVKIKYIYKQSKRKYISIIQNKIIYGFFIKYFAKLIYSLKCRGEYDTEIAFMEGWPTKLISQSKKNSRKIAWIHIDLKNLHYTKNMFLKGEEQKSYEIYDKLIFVSEDAKKSFNDIFNIDKSKQEIIYNPTITNEVIELSKNENINNNGKTIVSVGRLNKQKGYERLIYAHANVVKEHKHRLVIIGEGTERSLLENLIKDLDLKESVELKGFIENPYPYVKAADIFISSSITEGYPLVLLEAITLGKAIIGTNVTGNREILNDDVGYLCSDSQSGLEDAMKLFLTDDKIIEKYENNARERAKSMDYKKIIRYIQDNVL